MPITIPKIVLLTKPLVLEISCPTPPELWGPRSFQAEVAHVGKLRDELACALGASHNFGQNSFYSMTLPDSLEPGLYKLISFRVQAEPPSGEKYIELLDRSSDYQGCIHFQIVRSLADTKEPLRQTVRQAYDHRAKIIAQPHFTSSGLLHLRPQKYTGFVLCYGAILHAHQSFVGTSIIPYGKGLNYRSLLQSANDFSLNFLGFSIADDAGIARDYASQTSTCAIVFHDIRAANEDDALSYIATKSSDVITLIGLDRGFKPTPFAAFVWDGRNYKGHFMYGMYTGNLLAPFAGQSGARFDALLPVMGRSPRARLLLETYAEATAERDYAFKHLRYWTLLELIAKDSIQTNTDNILDAHGTVIVGNDGKPILTSGAAAKVYKYLFDGGAASQTGSYPDNGVQKNYQIEAQTPIVRTEDVEVYTLWDVIGSLIEVRNHVAHTGTFVPSTSAQTGSRLWLASKFYKHPTSLLFMYLQDQTERAVLREVYKL